jgi:hypothetical protein
MSPGGGEGSVTSERLLLWGCVTRDTFTAERYCPHQIQRHKFRVQAPAPKSTTRLVKDVSHTTRDVGTATHSGASTTQHTAYSLLVEDSLDILE